MTRLTTFPLSLAGLLLLLIPSRGTAVASDLTYPMARTVEQSDTYHGVTVDDPYRWMEQPSGELTTWVSAQTELLATYTQALPGYEHLEERIRTIRSFDAYGTPTRGGTRYFHQVTPAGAAHPILHVQEGPDGDSRALLNLADALEPGRRFGGMSPSPDGGLLVWADMSPGRWGRLRLLEVDGARMLDTVIPGVAGNSAIWTLDGEGFFYIHYGHAGDLDAGRTEPNSRLLYHRLGTEPARDQVILESMNGSGTLYRPQLTNDGRLLVVGVLEGSATENRVLVIDLTTSDWQARPLIDTADAAYAYEAHHGSVLYFRTTLDAPRQRLIGVDLERPAREHWIEILPETEANLNWVSHVGNRLVVGRTEHAKPSVDVHSMDGSPAYRLELPSIGLITGFNDDAQSSVVFYRFNSLCDPGTIYRADLADGQSRVHRRPDLDYDPDAYVLDQVFCTSADGTRVPIFVAYRRGTPRDGSAPLFMYGYGHGGWVAFPWFQPHLVAWLDMGGVYALPGCRGGGEYGDAWRDAGMRLNKPNAIADFVAAAEFLIDADYTSPKRLVANGGSASGVMAAAAVVARPDLFGAAVIDWPFLDMLRYQHFTTLKGWTRNYGSSEDPEEFDVLHGYSPLHNLDSDACYPAILTLVGEEDATTVPMHGYKFTAALQARGNCGNPALLMSLPGAGHYSYGTTPERQVTSQAQTLAFVIRALGLEPPGIPQAN